MMIFAIAIAMTAAMLIATALSLHQEAHRVTSGTSKIDRFGFRG